MLACAGTVRELEATDAMPVPTLLVAVTVKVYAVPLAKRLTKIGEEVPLAVTAVPPPTGVAVTV